MLLFLLLAACPEATEEVAVTPYASTMIGEDLSLGLVVGDEAFTAYSCGRDLWLPTHTQWFSGTGDGVDLYAEKDGWTLRGTWGVDAEIELTSPWNAPMQADLTPSEQPLLYEAYEEDCRDGLVALDDGLVGASGL